VNAIQSPAGVEPDGLEGDVIRLVLPAEAEYGRIARITASSLALRLGFPFPEIEDLRIAIDEMVILLLRPEGSAGLILLTFTVAPDRLEIEARTTAGRDQPWVDDAARHRFDEIVEDLVDSHSVEDDGRLVTLAKRRPNA
jgi:anti-sigma regulatory factor (Ser/Thr protein kinase)